MVERETAEFTSAINDELGRASSLRANFWKSVRVLAGHSLPQTNTPAR